MHILGEWWVWFIWGFIVRSHFDALVSGFKRRWRERRTPDMYKEATEEMGEQSAGAAVSIYHRKDGTHSVVHDYCCSSLAAALESGDIENQSDGTFAVPSEGQLLIWNCAFCPWCGKQQGSTGFVAHGSGGGAAGIPSDASASDEVACERKVQ